MPEVGSSPFFVLTVVYKGRGNAKSATKNAEKKIKTNSLCKVRKQKRNTAIIERTACFGTQCYSVAHCIHSKDT